jgi:hypothetical protein
MKLPPRAMQQQQRELVLSLWHAGKNARAISMQLGKPYGSVRNIVTKARQAGDPRATIRRGIMPAMHKIIGRNLGYKSTPGRVPPHLRPVIIREAAKRGTDAAGLIEAVLTNVFESEWFLRVVLKEDD